MHLYPFTHASHSSLPLRPPYAACTLSLSAFLKCASNNSLYLRGFSSGMACPDLMKTSKSDWSSSARWWELRGSTRLSHVPVMTIIGTPVSRMTCSRSSLTKWRMHATDWARLPCNGCTRVRLRCWAFRYGKRGNQLIVNVRGDIGWENKEHREDRSHRWPPRDWSWILCCPPELDRASCVDKASRPWPWSYPQAWAWRRRDGWCHSLRRATHRCWQEQGYWHWFVSFCSGV